MNRRHLLRILSRPPEQRWPDAVLHHGLRIVLLVLLAGAVSALFPVSPLANAPPVERGGVIDEDVVAEVPFEVPKSEEELQRERQEAAAGVNPIFVYDSTAIDSMLSDVDRFFARVDSMAEAAEDEREAAREIESLLAAYALPNGPEETALLLDPRSRNMLQRTVRDVILDELPRGIARRGELEEVGSRRIRILGLARERTVPTDSVLQLTDLYDRARRLHVPPTAGPGYEQLQHLLLVRFNVPSLKPDRSATEAARERARAAVKTIKAEIMRGQRIVPAREPVTEEHLERFRAYQDELERLGEVEGGRRGLRTLGGFLFNMIALSLFGVLLYYYRPSVYGNARHVTVIAILVAALVAVAALIATYDQPVTLLPIAFPALVVAILWDGRLALNLSLVLAVLLSGQTPFLGMVALLTLVTGGAVASLSVRVMRRRAEIWAYISLITAAYVLISVVLGLLRGWSLMEIGISSGWGAVNAVASAFAAVGFLPLLESVTKITTDQTLLELADANRPLLRRLSMEAPGTYAHSINVANLAEAAAGAIGANTLLTRVGVYYHDVGKIERPHYFIENQPGKRNPHDKLKPATSAQVVRDHVTNGLELADEAKLPDCVKAFITEHHGTQAISFFYDEARKADPEGELDPDDYTYPGPRPRSRETAIVMLADSVESAARVLPDPTPESIRELVDRIVRGKMDAGQLDETPLTLGELSRVKDQFVSVLTGMYHQRIDYPPRETAAEPGGPGEPGSDQSPDTVAAVEEVAGRAAERPGQESDPAERIEAG
ncbi:MAG: HD family phosphohydrolase [Gemmatimonadota bacterium]